jgi:RNA polymerase sigma-70 factor (ECF subfamily)
MEDHDPADSEKRLIREVRDGRLESYEQLIHLHAARLKAFISMRLPIAHLVEEIAHEAFVFAYNHLEDFELGTDFGKWLRAIAYNLVRKEVLRHSRNEKNQEKYLEHCLVQRAASGDDGLRPDSPVVAYLEECLEKLPDGQRKLLGERYRWSRTTREIAEITGRSEAWVRTTLCRVRAALRTCVEGKLDSAENARATG